MSRVDNEERPGLDVYAQPFIPQALRNVNEAPANVIPCTAVRWIDFAAYVSTFAGSEFLTPNLIPAQMRPSAKATDNTPTSSQFAKSELRSSSSQDPVSQEGADKLIDLNIQKYHAYFREALTQEAIARHKECEDHALYRVPVTNASRITDPRPSMYRLHVPGLRELSLRIEVDDIVQLRQLRFKANGEITYGSVLRDPSGNPIALPKKSDNQHDSVVWNIDRLRETLSLRVDSLAPRSMLFNVRFTVQSGRLGAMYRAVIAAHMPLAAAMGGSESGWMRSMLFPDMSDGYYQKSLNRMTVEFDLHDSLLNYEQLRAVNTVLNETYGPVPYVISGPPGTGKTKTIVELALQLAARQESTHVLVCAPSDPAADTLVHRLSKHMKPTELVRINSPSRSFPEVPNTILPYCFIDDGMFSLPPFQDLMRLKILVCTCQDAELLLRARVSNRDLCELKQKLHTAIHPEREPAPPKQLHWTGLLMDEAAQATEPEALIPLCVVAPPDDHAVEERRLPFFVMAGDQHQLGPRTASKIAAMQTSLFERLLDRPFYREHPLARSKQSGGVMRPLTQEMLPILRPAFTNLIRNYRSHVSILAIPSALFYNDTLEPEATNTNALLSWPGWRGRRWPVLFVSNTSPDEIEQDGGGWYNVREAQTACQYTSSFLQTGLLHPSEICIMSPFRAQVRILRKIAREPPFSMPGVNIGPLEAFQGLESRVVILCTMRTRDRFVEQDVARGLGVIHEPRRFNVALTRARQGLVVIGNAEVLERDRCWDAFLSFCGRNGLCEGCEDGELSSKAKGRQVVSRLERRLLHRDATDTLGADGSLEAVTKGVRQLGTFQDDEASLWQSGVAAEAVLREET